MNFQSPSAEITTLIVTTMVLKSGGYASSLKDTNQLLPICLLSYKELPTQFLTDMLGMPMRPLQLYLESPEQESFYSKYK